MSTSDPIPQLGVADQAQRVCHLFSLLKLPKHRGFELLKFHGMVISYTAEIQDTSKMDDYWEKVRYLIPTRNTSFSGLRHDHPGHCVWSLPLSPGSCRAHGQHRAEGGLLGALAVDSHYRDGADAEAEWMDLFFSWAGPGCRLDSTRRPSSGKT